ncbi:MFS transporter [Paenibacillus filicis]|uniref:MFS transporter n=1 Tax=Paenibacillus gyeongsangnamensis TaxID=3388067 RepID=A0ABT4QJK8_9BACL|nr:MFS transporter [Paenibacillus filicis]MCZ8517062.1 MFS transporter [Paenibacillus filicis]
MNDKIVMPVWTFVVFIVLMNTTMFNVSIPSIIRDIGVSAALGSWIISSYTIGYALSTMIYSRLSDVLPIRRLLWIGLSILGLSSVFGSWRRIFKLCLWLGLRSLPTPARWRDLVSFSPADIFLMKGEAERFR